MVEWDAIPIQEKQGQNRIVSGKSENFPSARETIADIFFREGKYPVHPAIKNHH